MKLVDRIRLIGCCAWLLGAVLAASLWVSIDRKGPDPRPQTITETSCSAHTALLAAQGITDDGDDTTLTRRSRGRRSRTVPRQQHTMVALLGAGSPVFIGVPPAVTVSPRSVNPLPHGLQHAPLLI